MKWMVLICLAAGLALSQPLSAQEPVPIAIAESELFEAVGRLEKEGMSWFVDHAESNAPVLGATLEVEFAGTSRPALFRPERGDYLLADENWLRPLRQPGQHALALTLLSGADGDLLATELRVELPENTASTAGRFAWAWLLAGLGLTVGWTWYRGRKLRHPAGDTA